MDYGEWKPYVSVAQRRAKAEKAAAKARKGGAILMPIAPFRGAIAKTFWGKAWCDNLENYSDYANRLPRGSSYVRNGSVIDLQITPGAVRAQVMGSSLYTITARVTAVPDKPWKTICADCSGSIDSLVELLQGKLSNAVMERICKPGSGLFPSPKEIKFNCSCPDWASMCKHVAAVLYGIGTRLDQQPELLFSLRGVDVKDLVSHAGAGLAQTPKRPASGRVLDKALLADVFGLEMAEAPPPVQRASRSGAPVAKAAAKAAAKPTAKKVVKGAAPASAKPPARSTSSPAEPASRAASGKVAGSETKTVSSIEKPKARKVTSRRPGVRAAKDTP